MISRSIKVRALPGRLPGVRETSCPAGREMNWSHRIERLLIWTGLLLGAFFVLWRAGATAGSQLGHVGFEMARGGTPGHGGSAAANPPSTFLPTDFSLWSEKRIMAYGQSLATQLGSPLALLQIPKIHLDVPVFNGTDETILSRGVGRIIGTSRVGVEGNLGIAGHRDGFFRALKDVGVGDLVTLVTPAGQRVYEVKARLIVTPDNVDVLRNRGVPMLTLVTCYPFYFIGDAPQRYILQCSLKDNGQKFRN
jgi:sortase A